VREDLFIGIVVVLGLAILLTIGVVTFIIRAAAPEDPSSPVKRQLAADEAVAVALLVYQKSGSSSTICPSCNSVIELSEAQPAQSSGVAIVQSICSCGICNASYSFSKNARQSFNREDK